MTSRRFSARALPAVLLAIVLGTAGCSPSAAPHTAPPSSAAPATGARDGTSPAPTTSTTTTTLPVPVVVGGTSVPGDALLGVVRRVPVVAVPAGLSTAPLPALGAPGYLSLQRVAFRRFGAGPDLLLLMGQDGSMSWWEPSLLQVLARHYRVTEFDYPGIGYSAPALAPVTLAWLADETAGLMQALGLAQANVLGWGLGGEVALALAERHPASARSLVLVDTSAGGRFAARPSAGVSALLDSPAANAASLAPVLFAAGPPSPAEAAWLAAVDSTVPDSVTRAGLAEERAVQQRVWSTTALSRSAGSVVVPTLVVFGADDAVFPASDGLLLRRSITGSQLVELPGAGYASMFEDSSQFVTSLEQFTG